MSQQHTPGPWRVEDDAEEAWTQVQYDFNGQPATICDAYSFSREQRLADARLIAAAPDLLAACEALLKTVIAAGRDHATSAALGRAAIAKAVGP